MGSVHEAGDYEAIALNYVIGDALRWKIGDSARLLMARLTVLARQTRRVFSGGKKRKLRRTVT